MPVAPITPKPPAPDTAATSSAPAPAPNPTDKIGQSMPSIEQSGVASPSAIARLCADPDSDESGFACASVLSSDQACLGRLVRSSGSAAKWFVQRQVGSI
jgi:hypothetical protein